MIDGTRFGATLASSAERKREIHLLRFEGSDTSVFCPSSLSSRVPLVQRLNPHGIRNVLSSAFLLYCLYLFVWIGLSCSLIVVLLFFLYQFAFRFVSYRFSILIAGHQLIADQVEMLSAMLLQCSCLTQPLPLTASSPVAICQLPAASLVSDDTILHGLNAYYCLRLVRP